MKRPVQHLTFALALLVPVAQPANAADSCVNARSISSEIMDYRQRGMSKTEVQNKIRDSGHSGNSVMARMVDDAYEQPAYTVEAKRRQAIADFATRWNELCVSLRR